MQYSYYRLFFNYCWFNCSILLLLLSLQYWKKFSNLYQKKKKISSRNFDLKEAWWGSEFHSEERKRPSLTVWNRTRCVCVFENKYENRSRISNDRSKITIKIHTSARVISIILEYKKKSILMKTSMSTIIEMIQMKFNRKLFFPESIESIRNNSIRLNYRKRLEWWSWIDKFWFPNFFRLHRLFSYFQHLILMIKLII